MSRSQQVCSALIQSVALAFFAGGCTKRYRPPELPQNQLATVSVDSRATLLSVDGLSPPLSNAPVARNAASQGKPPLRFWVGTGCRAFTVKYEESYFIWGEKKAARKGLGQGLWPALANTEVHTYETFKPIAFFVPVRAGQTYWITATFTGDEFLPRIVEIEPSGEAVGRFLPDVPCGAR